MNNDPDTNKYLVQVIGEQYTEDLHRDKLCADGQRRNLFGCPRGYANVRSALAGIREFNLKVEVFKETAGGKIVHFDLWKKSVQKAARQGNHLRKVHRAA